MADYLEKLLADLPWQFRDKEKITALYEVLAEEFQEIHDFYMELRDLRHIAAAEGKQLDGIGDIVVLSRAEAGLLAGDPIPYNVIDDEEYRKFLYYKIFKNTSICTYPDVMKSVRMFWDGELYYTEDPAVPATMIFNTPLLEPTDDPRPLFKAPLIRAAGVTLFLLATTEAPEEEIDLRVTGTCGGSHMETELPFIVQEVMLETSLHITADFQSIMITVLPELQRRRS